MNFKYNNFNTIEKKNGKINERTRITYVNGSTKYKAKGDNESNSREGIVNVKTARGRNSTEGEIKKGESGKEETRMNEGDKNICLDEEISPIFKSFYRKIEL